MLKQALEQCKEVQIDGSEIEVVYRNAVKIQYLRDLANTKSDQDAALADLKKKLSSLSKLEIVKKVPKNERIATKPLLSSVNEIMQREGQTKTQKKLQVPDNLICPISGDIMTDPVLIQSGQTFEREAIAKHFEMMEQRAEKKRQDGDSDLDEDRIFTCPVSGKSVDKNMILPNKHIKQAAQVFLRRNPWAYDFDPRVNYTNIRL